jgi:4-amino-4-deoxy-L-arabinose transferase-like glycosyltransferase
MPVDTDPRTEKYLLLIWIMVNLIVGILTVHDFGVSFDEPRYYLYAEQSLDSYRSLFGLLSEPVYGPGNLRYYGPSFIILVELIARSLQSIFTNVLEIDIWHLSYFVLFQLTRLVLYSLTKRWFSRWSAWAVLLLFTTQPLLWGHAFMNPKDIPFMAFMVFSVFAGYRVLDSLDGRILELSLQTPIKKFSEAWSQIDSSARKRYLNLLSAEADIVMSVERDGAVFSVLEYVKDRALK